MLLLLNEFKEHLTEKGTHPGRIRSAVNGVIKFSVYMKTENMRKISKKDIEKYKIYLMTEYLTKDGKRLHNVTIAHKLSFLMMYFRFLLQRKKIFLEPTYNLEFPKWKRHFPDYIPDVKDIAELLAKPDVFTYQGIRDRTIIELLYTCPLRNVELRELTLGDVDMKEKFIYPKRAKNGYECGIPILRSTYIILSKYLEIARPRLLKYAKVKTDKLFLTVNGRPLTGWTLAAIFSKYRGKRRIHPHLMRHACAVHLLRNGARIREIQILLGHKRLSSTQLYTRLTANDLKELHEKHHPRERRFKRATATKRV